MFDFITKTVSKIFGSKSDKDIKEVMPLVEKTKAEFEKLASLSHDQLRNKTLEFRERIAKHLEKITGEIKALEAHLHDGTDIDPDQMQTEYAQIDKLKKEKDAQLEVILLELLPEAFAVVKEAARRLKENPTLEVTATDHDRELAVQRDSVVIVGDKAIHHNNWLAAGTKVTWDMVHYDVQLIGGAALHQGKIAEMATGEGKTLVATLPAYLNGLSSQGVHMVTVNDYLARRDSEWMGPLYEFLFLTVDCIDKHQPNTEERRKAYMADITFGTNNEFGFDYLRDNMTRTPEEMVQRPHHYAMVDEVDSVLIDDARTPLIISGPTPKGEEHEFHELKPRIVKLVEEQKKITTGFLTEARRLIAEGKTGDKEGGLALLRAYRGLPKSKPLIKYLSETGTKQILQKTENYYLQDSAREMPKADVELYFVIDEKQNTVELTEKGIDLITGAGEDPRFFIMPDVGAEISEIEKMTVSEDEKLQLKDKLMQDFAIKSERIHSITQLLKAYALFEKEVEYVVVEGKVKIVDENTGRIMEGRRYSDGLHQAIEAKENVTVEAATQTFATVTLQNYFRMYHKLAGMTGTAETEAGEFWEIYKLDVVVIPTNKPITRKDDEDLVYKTKREKYNATIDKVVELTQAGRPVLVGTTSVEVSELMSRMLKMKGIKHNVLNAKQHQREADIVAAAGQTSAVTIATNMAGRGTDIKLGPGVREAGGLAIIGTERHESRRVDRQLRGRAGRQGDPGSSQFFVALEDNLMRMFGSDRIASLMDRMGYKDGEVIQHSMVSKSIERAQKKVEENNFGTRKRLLEYDDVMNSQRDVIYKRRRHALFGDRLQIDINNMFYDLCEEVINTNREARDFENFKLDVIRFFSTDTTITEDALYSSRQLADQLFHEVKDSYKRKTDYIVRATMPVLKDLHDTRGETIENVVIPFADGKRTMNVVCNLQKVMDTGGKEIVLAFEQGITLGLIDDAWKEHLREMDELKNSVQSAVYEQKDPLLIYKLEAFNLFKDMVAQINKDVTAFLFKANVPFEDQKEVKAARQPEKTDMSRMKAGRDDNNALLNATMPPPQQGYDGQDDGEQQVRQKQEPVRVGEKVGRNEPCPCGSGKKFKNCHGKDE